jgi:signal transduction histidine kinase
MRDGKRSGPGRTRRLLGPVRVRAALAATLVVAVALLALGLAVTSVVRSSLADSAQLKADSVVREVSAKLAAVEKIDDLDLPDVDEYPVQVLDARGRVLAQSDDLEGLGRALPQFAGAGFREELADLDAEDGDLVHATADLPVDDDGEATGDAGDAEGSAEYRLAAARVADRQDDDGDRALSVTAAAPLAEQQRTVSALVRSMLIGAPVLLLLIAAGTWLVVRRALRPVEAIRAELAEITAGDLSRRVPEPPSRDEVAQLARTTNATLAALEESVERQRRFVADASHELRSPIASLRTQLEVAREHPALLEPDELLAEVIRLQGLATDLLLLARLDAGEQPRPDRRVNVEALVREELAHRVGDRVPVRFAAPAGGVPEVAGSRGQLGRVLANLLDNAQRFAESEVRVALAVDSPGRLLLTVADDGPGVPVAERERIFERFVRLDAARTSGDGGAGLGLAIVRDVLLRHGGSITVGDAAKRGAEFRIRLPLLDG